MAQDKILIYWQKMKSGRGPGRLRFIYPCGYSESNHSTGDKWKKSCFNKNGQEDAIFRMRRYDKRKKLPRAVLIGTIDL